MSDLEAVLETVGDRIRPDAEERERMRAVAEELTVRAEAAIDDLPVDASVLQVGSTARGTWIAGDRDVDIFVRFPPDLDREELERYGLAVGYAVLPDGHEEYAEHPYVKGEYRGFDVDCVPCYNVPAATDIRSAVDRTPFHNQYLTDRLTDDLIGEVRLAKRFLKGIGAYGSNLRTQGFSGYLTELLVCEYDGFLAFLEDAANWTPPVHLDPEDHGQATFEDPLVVIDPTDPERNVAAVCSAENVARVQHYARVLLADPDETVFFPPDRQPMTSDEVIDQIRERGTTPIAVVFDTPPLVDDQLWPQLRKSLAGVTTGLDDRGFDVLRGTAMAATDRTALLVECTVAERPTIQRHEGPPVSVREHATGFFNTYASGGACGPFLDGDRYVVEKEREFTTASAFLESPALETVGLGAQIEDELANRDVIVGEAVGRLADEFGREFREYFDPRP